MGSVPDMGAIMRVARKHKLRVMEDGAQSCGARSRASRWAPSGTLAASASPPTRSSAAGRGRPGHHQQPADMGARQRARRVRRPVAARSLRPAALRGRTLPGTNYRMSELEAAGSTRCSSGGCRLRSNASATAKRWVRNSFKLPRDRTADAHDPDGGRSGDPAVLPSSDHRAWGGGSWRR